MGNPQTANKAFTLIELLIVVAIIAILAAIAVPNFLEAQIRSKVSRVKADHRSMATAIESYAVDWNRFPPEHDPHGNLIVLSNGNLRGGPQSDPTQPDWNTCEFSNICLVRLTTPVAYFSSTAAMKDPFALKGQRGWKDIDALLPEDGFFYVNFSDRLNHVRGPGDYPRAWGLLSFGPNHMDDGIMNDAARSLIGMSGSGRRFIYDPSNGTVSDGDITRFGGAVNGEVINKYSSLQ